MFEQAVLKSERNPWSMCASASLQIAVVSAGLLFSLMKIEPIAAVKWSAPLPPLPSSVTLVPVVARAGSAGAVMNANPAAVRPFVQPSRVPSGVPAIVDDLNAPQLELGSGPARPGETGVPHGLGDYIGAGTGLDRLAPPAAAPPTVSTTVKRVPVGGMVQEAKIVTRVLPVYPAMAKIARISGVVRLVGVIARDGTVQSLQTVAGHPYLVKAAVEAVRQWRYQPTLLNGTPVEVVAPIEVRFVLGGN